MASSVTINGKEYVPSTTLVRMCGYSADYISKLAREEKVLGTQIGRQWFIEPESLTVFIKKAEIQKEIKKQELRAQRKSEQLSVSDKNKNASFAPRTLGNSAKQSFEQKSLSAIALAQAMVVFVCIVFAGSLGWLAASNGIGLRDLSVAAFENGAFTAHSVLPFSTNKEVWSSEQNKTYVAASDESVLIKSSTASQVQGAVYTLLPQFSTHTVTSSATATSALAAKNNTNAVSRTTALLVSDDVDVSRNADGSQIISPIFKNGTSSSEQFRIVPVTSSKK